MVQILPQGHKSKSQQILEGLDQFIPQFNQFIDKRERQSELNLQEQRNQQQIEALSKISGMDLSGIRDPKVLERITEHSLKNRDQLTKAQSQQKQQEIVAKALSGQKLTSQEQSQLPVDVQTKLEQLSKPKRTASTFEAIPPEISEAMNKIVSSLPNANADELKMNFDQLGIPPGYSNPYVENRRRQDERSMASKDKRLESGHKRAEKVLDKADKLGEELPILESSVMAMEDAIVNGDQSFWSPDNIAEITGIELFRTAKGGQFKTAAKTYFINDLKTSGARPNQFIEKQFVDALAKVGRSQEANQTVLESFKFSNDLKKKWLETSRELEKYYENSLGYLPGSFNSRVQEMMEPYVKDRQKQYENRLKEIHLQEKKKSKRGKNSNQFQSGMVQVIGPNGEIGEVAESELGEMPEGWRIQ